MGWPNWAQISSAQPFGPKRLTALSPSSIPHQGTQRLVHRPWCPWPTKPSPWYMATVRPSRSISPCVDRRTLGLRVVGVYTVGNLSQHTNTRTHAVPPYGKWSHGRKTERPIRLGGKVFIASQPPLLLPALRNYRRVTAFLALVCPQP